MASMNTAVSCRSVTPGASAASVAASARSATATEARMASTSSGDLTRRARSSSWVPSTTSASGKAVPRRDTAPVASASVATTFAVAAPSTPWSTARKVFELNEMP